jgi:acetyl-CoA carboxylase alpha subunit
LANPSGAPGVRAGLDELLGAQAFDVLALHGTAEGESDPALLLALAQIGGTGCVLVGQHRRLGGNDAAPGPASLRQARRGMALAAALGLPLVTVIDTAGAELSPAAEEGGLAGAIACCLLELVELDVPVLSVLLGAGVVDVIVPEGPDTAEGRLRFRQAMAGTVAAALATLAAQCPAERQQRRRDKYSRLTAVPQPAA